MLDAAELARPQRPADIGRLRCEPDFDGSVTRWARGLVPRRISSGVRRELVPGSSGGRAGMLRVLRRDLLLRSARAARPDCRRRGSCRVRRRQIERSAGSPAASARDSRCRARPTSTPSPPRMFLMIFCSKVSSSSSCACWACDGDRAAEREQRAAGAGQQAEAQARAERFVTHGDHPIRQSSRQRPPPTAFAAIHPAGSGRFCGAPPEEEFIQQSRPPRQRWRHPQG